MTDVSLRTTEKQWKVAEPVAEARRVFASFNPLIADILWRRGIQSEEAAHIFFEPDFDRDIHDPFLFAQMNAAVARIFGALERGEYITVHGDYDADGVTGSTVITTALRELGRLMDSVSVIDFYIPHREREGYGLHEPTVEILKKRGTTLIITVDCGISSRAAIAYAHNCGMDTIVVDHHEFPPELPEAILIHPRLPGESYPFPYLAAVGVSWKVACALIARARERGLPISEGAEKWLLDLVAIATVTDVMPLVGENRTLEFFGLRVLARTRRLGLQKLMEVAGVKREKLDTYAIGFQIGPRINAAGRMEHAEAAFRLLMSEDSATATLLAQKLNEQNQARQRESNQMFAAARLQVLEHRESAILIATGDGWSAGLVGLVAGKLVNEFGKPVLVMGRDGERVVGSGRSIPGFHITEALRQTGDCLAKCGGHPQACGFTIIGTENYERFVVAIQDVAMAKLVSSERAPVLSIEGEIALGDLTWNFVELILKCAPFGEANSVPRFLTADLEVVGADRLGENGKHLRLMARDGRGNTQKFIGFSLGERGALFSRGARCDIVYEVGINEWNGSREVQCKIVDLRLSV